MGFFGDQRSAKKMVDKCETTVLGNGGMEFHELLPNDSGENGVSIAVHGFS